MSTKTPHSPPWRRLPTATATSIAVVACVVTYGVGFGIGHLIKGPDHGSSGSTTTTQLSSSQEREAISKLEDALGYAQSARQIIDGKVNVDTSSTSCDKASDVADQLHEAINDRELGIETANQVARDNHGYRLARELATALATSNESDNARGRWVDGPYNTWQKGGCKGATPTSDDYNQYLSLNDRANDQKQTFVDAFNPLADKHGLRSDWSTSDF